MKGISGMPESRCLSVAQWHELARTGLAPPMRIPLDGDSMLPLIRRGIDRVTVVPLKRPVRVGDVVLFESPPGRYVVHRVFRLRLDSVQTLGDHCAWPDAWMPQSSVLGLIVQAERGRWRIPLDTDAACVVGRAWMAFLPCRRVYLNMRYRVGWMLRKMGLRR